MHNRTHGFFICVNYTFNHNQIGGTQNGNKFIEIPFTSHTIAQSFIDSGQVGDYLPCCEIKDVSFSIEEKDFEFNDELEEYCIY